MKKIGIALSGGGSRGFAHLGVLKALEEKGIEFDVISGTSAGSIVGALLASGLSVDEIFSLMKAKKFTDYAKIAIFKDGFMTLESLKKNLTHTLKEATFEQLPKALYISVSNINTGEVEYLHKGNVVDAVIASSSIPILFEPIVLNQQTYVDGGLLDNLPIVPLLSTCDIIVAVNVMPVEKLQIVDGMRDVALRIFEVGIGHVHPELKARCDLYVEPKGIDKYHILDPQSADELFELGYQATKNHPDLDGLVKKIHKKKSFFKFGK